MKTLIAAACLCAAISLSMAAPPHAESSKHDEPKLIVISMDALMFKQLNEKDTPVISNFYKNGVHCPTLKPVFPTKTMTNHFSIVTGLYAGSHGVTANRLYDNVNKKKIKYSAEFFKANKDVTPIWTLNQMAGKHSAVSMWASSEFEFRGTMPTYCENFERNAAWKPRIDKLIPLLKRENDPVNLVMFYSEEPDSTEHAFSVKSTNAAAKLKDMDNLVKYLIKQLEEEGLSHNTDVIIMSDHGMETVVNRDDRIIYLDQFVRNDSYTWYGDSAVMQIIANDNHNIMEICDKLKEGSRENGHFNAYKNADLPEEWHVRNDQFFGPCTLVAEPGYAFQNIFGYFNTFEAPGTKVHPNTGREYGYHGYDNRCPSMQATFLANGPRFNKNVKIPSMEIVDLYHLFARLLGIQNLVKDLNIDGVDRRDIWKKMLKK